MRLLSSHVKRKAFTLVFRLDFDNLVNAQPPTTGACSESGDFLTLTSPAGGTLPVTCGTLTGQHSRLFIKKAKSGLLSLCCLLL